MPVMSRAQNRAVTAGSIMMPTASSVPSAWKPPTRFITTSARKAICAGPPARLTERRKPGSTHSSTSGRQISARTTSDTLAMPTIRNSAGSSTASTEPNRKCSRSTLLPLTETMRDAERERNQEERGERGVLLELRSSARSGRRRPRSTKPAISPPAAMANRLEPREQEARSPRPAGSHAPWRRRSGSCAAASGTRRSAPRRTPARTCRPARGA